MWCPIVPRDWRRGIVTPAASDICWVLGHHHGLVALCAVVAVVAIYGVHIYGPDTRGPSSSAAFTLALVVALGLGGSTSGAGLHGPRRRAETVDTGALSGPLLVMAAVVEGVLLQFISGRGEHPSVFFFDVRKLSAWCLSTKAAGLCAVLTSL